MGGLFIVVGVLETEVVYVVFFGAEVSTGCGWCLAVTTFGCDLKGARVVIDICRGKGVAWWQLCSIIYTVIIRGGTSAAYVAVGGAPGSRIWISPIANEPVPVEMSSIGMPLMSPRFNFLTSM